MTETTHDGGAAAGAVPPSDEGRTAARLAAEYGPSVPGARPSAGGGCGRFRHAEERYGRG
ncbi:hypothetical protein ACWC24_36440 [Streptomyces sp. NPDC001443]